MTTIRTSQFVQECNVKKDVGGRKKKETKIKFQMCTKITSLPKIEPLFNQSPRTEPKIDIINNDTSMKEF